MNKPKLSVVLATKNEEVHIGVCLKSVQKLFADLPAQAGEIIVYDEYSIDKTREIAKTYGARVFKYKHTTNWHQTKQKAINKASGEWILQLDADEIVTKSLAMDIRRVMVATYEELVSYRPKDKKKWELTQRHQRLIEEREGSLGKKTGEVVAFFVPRLNLFLGKPLKHAGKYPDGVIRLFKNGKAKLPAKSVHELMKVNGEVGWIFSDLEHHEYPTLFSYLSRMNRYTDLQSKEFGTKSIFHLLYYSSIKPILVFLNLYIIHNGFLDGMHGFIWSALSASHFPIAYFKYWQMKGD